ncbi:MAG: peptidase [Rhodobacteraceae bacterium]|nr:peptidase [Paracoccaceae bacterium]
MMVSKIRILTSAGLAALLLSGPALATDKSAVVETYAAIAEATYADSLTTAKALGEAVETLISQPSPATLTAAKTAWLRSRVPYQQSEVYRFGNPIVDDWEGKVNAWPLDEGLIDYVDGDGGPTDENPHAGLNVIANTKFTLSGEEIDASNITPALLSDTLHEVDEVEANVATGYHAIEFLLWGQDLNGTGPGAGNRPYTDYVQGEGCTSGACDRRAAYLKAATDLLISDLEEMAAAWKEGGAARAELAEKGEDGGVITILTGMGSLSYGEQAGERMKLGLMLNDPEEEHDCFADNTHNSHYYDGLGVRNVYIGRYVGVDGRVVTGPSLSELIAAKDAALDAQLKRDLDASMAALGAIKSTAEAGMAYDQMLDPENEAGGALIQAAVDALVAQTRSIEKAVAALEIEEIAFEGSDSLDDPEAVFQ